MAIEVHLESLRADLTAIEQLLLYVGVSGCRHESRQPVESADNVVGNRARLNMTWPADDTGHAEGTFPIRVLLRPKRRCAGIRPGVLVRAIVGGVENDGVAG